MFARALTELFHGKGAHANPFACIEDLSHELAARQIEGFPHSIGQLVFHMNYWMDYELHRIRDERPAYPEHNAESFPPASLAANAQEWQSLQKRFAELLKDFVAVANSSPQEMQRQIDSGQLGDTKLAGTLEAVLWQMVAHNSYHTGQIAVIRRVLGAWPPRGGGDAW